MTAQPSPNRVQDHPRSSVPAHGAEPASEDAVLVIPERRWPTWRSFPLRGERLRLWLAVGIAFIVVGSAIGWLILGPLHGWVGPFDHEAARWFESRRTPLWTDLSFVGNLFAESIVKIPATILLSLWFMRRWRRWREAALLGGALLLESSTFVLISWIVGRDRPDVEQLDAIPLSGAFPSGHTGAAVAFWGAMAVIVWWHSRRATVRSAATAAAVLIPIIVAVSRLYRGMHQVTDVTFGAVVGGIALLATHWVMCRMPSRAAADRENSVARPLDYPDAARP